MKVPTYKNLTFEQSRRLDYLYLVEVIFPDDMTEEMKNEMKTLVDLKSSDKKDTK